MAYIHTKHFTLQEAREMLKTVKPIVEIIVQLKRILDSKGYDIYHHRYLGGSGPNGEKHYPPEFEELILKIQELESTGALLKRINEGLVDFPHIRSNGEEVYLCWKLGEDDIYYWHSIQDGFIGRRLIDEL